MIELKPCPFCGGSAEYFDERVRIMGNAFLMGVKCKVCGGAYMTSDKSLCPNDVYKAWNARIPEVTVNQFGGNAKFIGRVENLTIGR